MATELIFAPVVIPTLCRFEHLKRCISSLAKCSGVENTELYIGVDYPAKDAHWEGYKKICDYLPTILGFKNVYIFIREYNYGPLKNARELMKVVEEKYDRYIFSEDDNEFSANFLEYMNKGLAKYEDNPDVIGICGFAEPRSDYKCLASYPYNAYPMIGYNAWGMATWFSKKAIHVPSDEILFSFRTILKIKRMDHGVAIHRMFKRRRSNAVGDLQWRIYCALNHKYCIFPKITKVRNWGFDGSGENCSVMKKYSAMELDTAVGFCYDDFEIKDYAEIRRLQKELYGFTFIDNVAFYFEYLLFRITDGMCLRDIYIFRKIMEFKRKIQNL